MRTLQQKLTLPSGYVSGYVSAGKPAIQSVRGSACEQSAYCSEFEVGAGISEEDFSLRASRRAQLAAVVESLY